MKQAIKNQMKMTKVIATAIYSDERTAFRNASQVKRQLTVPVTEALFIELVKLCHKIGTYSFSKCLVLRMVNANQSKESINRYMGVMLNAA